MSGFSRLVLIVAGLAASLLSLPTAASAQSPAAYVSLIERYATGDEERALMDLSRWNAKALDDAIEGWMQRRSVSQPGFAGSPQALRAAAMMHTDLAYVFMVAHRSPDALSQARHAHRLVDSTLNDRADAATRTFGVRWYALTTGMLTAHGLFETANQLVLGGIAKCPRAPELFIARGSIPEMRGNLEIDDELRRGIGSNGRLSNRAARLLESAAADFQHALDLDGTMALAHLHRGWVHVQLRDSRASGDLEAGLATATDDDTRYLAHMFLGAAAERHGDLAQARHEFESARALGEHQSAYVALTGAEAALGHADRAHELAVEYAGLSHDIDDPWADYHLGGFSAAALNWLRREARHL